MGGGLFEVFFGGGEEVVGGLVGVARGYGGIALAQQHYIAGVVGVVVALVFACEPIIFAPEGVNTLLVFSNLSSRSGFGYAYTLQLRHIGDVDIQADAVGDAFLYHVAHYGVYHAATHREIGVGLKCRE